MTCPKCNILKKEITYLKEEVEFYKQPYLQMKALLVEILSHEDCLPCCGKRLPFLGWYSQIKEIFKSQSK